MLLALVRLEHQVDRLAVRAGVLEQGRDVVEEDARLGEVGDLADLRAKLLGGHGIGTSSQDGGRREGTGAGRLEVYRSGLGRPARSARLGRRRAG